MIKARVNKTMSVACRPVASTDAGFGRLVGWAIVACSPESRKDVVSAFNRLVGEVTWPWSNWVSYGHSCDAVSDARKCDWR